MTITMAGRRVLTGIVTVLALMLSWRIRVGWLGRDCVGGGFSLSELAGMEDPVFGAESRDILFYICSESGNHHNSELRTFHSVRCPNLYSVL